MLKSVKRLVTGAAVLATAGAGLMIAPTAAQAASYNGVCGSGYWVIDSMGVNGGTVYLAYNGSTDCVVTVRDNPGTKLWMTAGVRISGTPWTTDTTDANYYSTYAGPRYVYAPGQCIDWAGQINGSVAAQYNTHCG